MNTLKIGELISPSYQIRESYKAARANLEFCGRENKVIMLTSCIPNEGKSSAATNLAYELACNHKKVLLLDADLRKSVIHEWLGVRVSEYKGLSHYLSGQCELDESIILCEDAPNLHMILAGSYPPNPSELFGSKRFETLIEAARARYDYVLIDTPPLANVIDSAIIGQKCDGVILVMASNVNNSRAAIRVRNQLQQANCKILGVLLNKVKRNNRSTYGTYGVYGRYYGKYYGKYYGDYGEHGGKS